MLKNTMNSIYIYTIDKTSIYKNKYSSLIVINPSKKYIKTKDDTPISHEIFNIRLERIDKEMNVYNNDIIWNIKIIKNILIRIIKDIRRADDIKLIDHIHIYDTINNLYNLNIFLFFRIKDTKILKAYINYFVINSYNKHIHHLALLTHILDTLKKIGLVSLTIRNEDEY